jgi:hypothetical protein
VTICISGVTVLHGVGDEIRNRRSMFDAWERLNLYNVLDGQPGAMRAFERPTYSGRVVLIILLFYSPFFFFFILYGKNYCILLVEMNT